MKNGFTIHDTSQSKNGILYQNERNDNVVNKHVLVPEEAALAIPK